MWPKSTIQFSDDELRELLRLVSDLPPTKQSRWRSAAVIRKAKAAVLLARTGQPVHLEVI